VTGLVLLHGFTGSPASFGELVAALRARRAGLRIACPWLLGHGSTPALGPGRFEAEVDRLAALLRAERLSGAHLCGYSLGARVALGLLARHPQLFSGVTLIGVNPGLGDVGERAARVGNDERWAQVLLRQGVHDFTSAWQSQPLFESQAQLSGTRLAEQQHIRASHTARGLAHALRVLGLGRMPDYRGVLCSSSLRVRLLVGALDGKFLAIARQLRAISGRAELDCVPGVGHNVLLEAPGHVAGVLTKVLEAAP
jgi:2-succinyl-6-hydroxy-2,4-cyclohexadiene-1-carboxylate synthase